MTRIAASVLNFRTPQMTLDCVRSLVPELDRERDELVVVDNHSEDGSAELLRKSFAEPGLARVRLIETERNGGFALGHNAAVRAIEADAYLLVNSDALFRAGAVATLWRRLDSDPRCAVVAPRLEESDGTPQTSCFRFHTPISEFVSAASTAPITRLLQRHEVPLPVRAEPESPDWTSFACVLVRGAALRAAGLLDESFFMYYEDVDLCRRLRRLGYTVASEPSARVVHRGGASSGVDAKETALRRRPRYFYASRVRYFRKHFGPLGPLAANLMWSAGRSISWARETFGRKAVHTVEHELLDRWRG
jgi:N-acetylglucosaminyl-diphospho-decaprenol L-rhamnosyltransferase